MVTENQVGEDQIVVGTARGRNRLWAHPRLKTAAIYAAAAVVALLALEAMMGLRDAHLRVPLTYQGDTMFYHLLVKGVIDHGWFLDNPALAAPGGLDLRDVPTSDNNFHLLLIKLLSLTTRDYPLVLNFFYLLGFPLTMLSSAFVLRRFSVSWPAALSVSLLYAFLPFHFARGQHHLFLSAYYQIPLIMLIILWVCRGELTGLRLRDPKWIFSLLVCAVVASSGYYYAFFACFFLAVAAAAAAWRERAGRQLWPALCLIGVLAGGVTLNLWPSVTQAAEQGTVRMIQRLSGEADIYGLRIAQILLPPRWHRLEPLHDLKIDYNLRPLINENDDASPGLIGSLGFLGLLGWLLFKKPELRRMNVAGPAGLLNHLSLLTGAALLLATIGGFGSLIAFFGLPQVRAYNRISIFISFFALCAVALGLDHLMQRYAAAPHRRLLYGLASAALVLVGLPDQVSPRYLPDYRRATDEYMNDEVFVRNIEAALPPEAMIFQLPVVSFPESLKIGKMTDYDHLRGYLHSRRLRWSYGTIKGRPGNVWQRITTAKSTPEMVETLSWAGFGGIYLDRFGYADGGKEMERQLTELLGASPLVSPNERQLCFDLTAYRQRLRERTPQTDWAAREEAALHPLLDVWQGGFSDQEGTPEYYWRWCGAQGRILLINGTSRPQPVTLNMTLVADLGGNLTITSPFFNERFWVQKEHLIAHSFTLPPGEHAIDFACDARRVVPPNDYRELVFTVRNFKLTQPQPAPPPMIEEQQSATPPPPMIEKKKAKAASR